MPNRHDKRKPRRCYRGLAGLLPLSALSFAVAATAQTTPSDKKTGGSSDTKTPAASSNSPSFSRGAPTGATPSPLVSEVTIEEPGLPVNTPPSFFGSSGSSATSSLGTPGFAAVAPSGPSSVAPDYPLQWGPFSFHPHLGYGFTYADGVLFTPGQPTQTALHSVSPGISILSQHLAVDYTPTLNYYSKGPYEDNLSHSATLSAHFGYSDWTFQLSQGYQNTSTPLVETGLQTDTQYFSTAFGASWNFSERWFFDFTLSQSIQDSEGFQNSRQWSTMEWANYRITPKLSVGAGLGGGYVNVDSGSDSAYEQIQGRINWHASKRLSVNLNGGVEIRQFLDTPGGSDNLVNPIMGASINYQVFEYTAIFLSANRTVDTSLFANQITENASVSGGISQRLLKYLNLGVSAGFRRSDYKSTFVFGNLAFPTLRRDDYSYVTASLGSTFLKKGSISVGYTHGDNQSNLTGYTYATDQFSFNVGYRF
jgi:hypothetical protein